MMNLKINQIKNKRIKQMRKNDLVIYCNEQNTGDKPMYKKELEGNLGKIFKVKRKSGGDISVYNENFHNFYNTNLFKKIKISNIFIKKYLNENILNFCINNSQKSISYIESSLYSKYSYKLDIKLCNIIAKAFSIESYIKG